MHRGILMARAHVAWSFIFTLYMMPPVGRESGRNTTPSPNGRFPRHSSASHEGEQAAEDSDWPNGTGIDIVEPWRRYGGGAAEMPCRRRQPSAALRGRMMPTGHADGALASSVYDVPREHVVSRHNVPRFTL